MRLLQGEVKTTLLLVLLAGYLLFGYSFMQLRIPPVGLGVPLGEMMLLLFLLGISVPIVLARIGAVVPLLPILILWLWGFTRLAIDAVHAGIWAFRDGTQLIESLYIIVGFALFSGESQISRLSRWVRNIIILACLYGLLYVFETQIAAVSPTLPGGSGQAIPIFGTFATTGTMLLWGSFYCMTYSARSRRDRILYPIAAAFLVSFAIIVIQMRTTYVQLGAMTALLLLMRPAALRSLLLALPVLAVLLLFISAFEIRIAGRLSSEVSFDFLWNHVQAIFGVSEKAHGGVAEAASGVSLRLAWWLRLYNELTSDLATLLTGLGFGIPLTDFRDTLDNPTREPHNSIISFVSRLGLVGGVCWFLVQIELFRCGLRTYRQCLQVGRYGEGRLVLLIVAYALLTLASCLGEDTMEKPYNAIPYYLLWGAALRVAHRLRYSTPDVRTEQTGLVSARSIS